MGSRRGWILFSLLAAIWGGSYLLIKLGLRGGFSPSGIVFARTLLASVVLIVTAQRLGAMRGIGRRIPDLILLAAIQAAGPFLLISGGERRIASSLAGILVAGAPIFTALLAVFIDHEERSRGASLVGLVAGMAGVVLLLGLDTGGGSAALLGGLMVVLASLCYALGGFQLKHRLADLNPIGICATVMAISAAMSLPLAAVTLPSKTPSSGALAAIVALGILGTGVSFGIFYTLIRDVGPARASLVAYVAPAFAVVYGVVFLNESFKPSTAVGVVLIIGGSWLAAEGRLPVGIRATARTHSST